MCQQNGMLVLLLNCLVLKELNEIKRKKIMEDMTVCYQYLYLTNVQAPATWACSHKTDPRF